MAALLMRDDVTAWLATTDRHGRLIAGAWPLDSWVCNKRHRSGGHHSRSQRGPHVDFAPVDPLITGLFSSFRKVEELEGLNDDDAFELFAAYLVLPNGVIDQQVITDLLLDKGTPGVDTIIIDVNGQVVIDDDDVKDICDPSSKIDVTVSLIQAKRSAAVDSAQILGFGDMASRFLQNQDLGTYPLLNERARALQLIFQDYAAKLKNRPTVNLYYVTSAPDSSLAETQVTLRAESVRDQVSALSFVGEVRVECIGATGLHHLWTLRSNRNEIDLEFHKQLNLPEMPGVRQAILGVVSAAQLVKLVRDRDGNLNERVFYDNVRGFQGSDNAVNAAILATLRSQDRSLVPVLNNGVTVVARSYSPKPGDTFAIADYQIVNGCQTSHCISFAYEELGELAERVYLPLRLVVTDDEEVANRIVQATNSQTPVTETDLVGLTRFQKRLEDAYKADIEQVGLTYERRPGQFFDKPVIKTRLISIIDQMRSVLLGISGLPKCGSTISGGPLWRGERVNFSE